MIKTEVDKINKEVTDKMSTLPQKVTDLTVDELREAHNVYWSSRILNSLDHVHGFLKDGYIPNKYELEALEQILSIYQLTVKSPLAQALNENKE